jgi:hypothetical protein
MLSALANDCSLLRALLTVVMMVLPFAVLAVIAGMGRRLWLRRRASQRPTTD